MYFSDNPNDRFYEVLMVSIPNFRLRGYEQTVIDKHIYDCRFCLYYIGHHCKLPRCDCIDERITAGAASLSETWQELAYMNGKLSFSSKSIRDIGEFGYTLYCAAKDIYTGSKHLNICDLADKDLIPPQLFELICNAMLIRRYGIAVLN